MRLLFLGSGTSHGVPVIGCDCEVCRSDDQRNKRTRASALVHLGKKTILIDTATELRQQVLRHDVRRVDAILFTHPHADHIHGIDDIRMFSAMQKAFIPAFANDYTIEQIKKRCYYIFGDTDFRLGWGIPRIDLRPIEGPTEICGTVVTPIPLAHGRCPVLGYRIGGLAYLTDFKEPAEDSWSLLERLDTLVVDALRHKSHPTHLSVSEALEFVERVKPRRAYLTHIAHDLDHAATEAALPPHVRLAYDGLEIEIPNQGQLAQSGTWRS